MADMKTLTLGGKTFNIMDAEARAKAIPTVQVGGDTLTWDGNTEGLVSNGVGHYKVSDATPTLNDFANGARLQDTPFTAEELIDMGHGVLSYQFGVIFVPKEAVGIDIQGVTFTEAGTYIEGSSNEPWTLTISGYTGFGSPKIDPAYLYQPDWNQNDETAADFIKNRPFGDVLTEIMPETEVVGEDADGIFVVGLDNQSVTGNESILIVNFDGTEYTCNPVGAEFGAKLFGNMGLMGGPDSGEPFCVDLYGQAVGVPAICLTDANPHMMSIKAISIKKLDQKYIKSYAAFYVTNSGNDSEYIYTDVGCTQRATMAEINAAAEACPIQIWFAVNNTPLACFAPLAIQKSVGEGYNTVTVFNLASMSTSDIFKEYYTAEYVPPTT